VISGLLNKQIAAELKITEDTVKFHRGHIMRKMRADSLADLVRMAENLRIRSHQQSPERKIDGFRTSTFSPRRTSCQQGANL